MKDRAFDAASRLLFTIEEAAALLALSRSQLYRLIEVEEISTVKVGKARRISKAQLDAFVRMLEQTSGFVRLARS